MVRSVWSLYCVNSVREKNSNFVQLDIPCLHPGQQIAWATCVATSSDPELPPVFLSHNNNLYSLVENIYSQFCKKIFIIWKDVRCGGDTLKMFTIGGATYVFVHDKGVTPWNFRNVAPPSHQWWAILSEMLPPLNLKLGALHIFPTRILFTILTTKMKVHPHIVGVTIEDCERNSSAHTYQGTASSSLLILN